MPSGPRSNVVRRGQVATYHVWSRCAQGAYLLGLDPITNEDFSHRKEIFEKLIAYQTGVFAVDVGSYAILCNHFHGGVRTRPDVVAGWSDEEVAWRWKRAWPTWRENQGDWVREPTDHEIQTIVNDPKNVERIRKALSDLSWFIARIKEPIAKLANKESGAKGHFWGERYGARFLGGDGATLVGNLYVDLNVLAAGLADSLQDSKYTSIARRIQTLKELYAEDFLNEFQEENLEFPGDFDLQRSDVLGLFADEWLSPIKQPSLDRPLSKNQSEITHPISAAEKLQPAESSRKPLAAKTNASVLKTEANPSDKPKNDSNEAKSYSPANPTTTFIHQRLLKSSAPRASEKPFLPMPITQYLRLATYAVHSLRERRKQGARDPDEPSIRPETSNGNASQISERDAQVIRTLGVEPELWLDAVQYFETWFRQFLGNREEIEKEMKRRSLQRCLYGIRRSGDVFY